MKVKTDSERVRLSRKMVLEFLGSSVDVGLTGPDVERWQTDYGADPGRYGTPAEPAAAGERDARHAGHHHEPDGPAAETVRQPVKVDNELYVRDYSKCILCYKCVEACGVDAQNTFAISVAGRGFDARISTEFDVGLPDSACVYCGNCIGVCPTGALMFTSEHEMREAGTWDESRPDGHGDDLPLLRRRLRSRGPRAGQLDREGDLAIGQRRDQRPPVHQGTVRVPVRSEPGARKPDGGPACLRSRASSWRAGARRGSAATSSPSHTAGCRCCSTPCCVWARCVRRSSSSSLPTPPSRRCRSAPRPVSRAIRPRARVRSPGSTPGCSRSGPNSPWSPAATCRTCRPGSCSRCCRSQSEAEVEAVALQDGDRFRPLPSVVRTARAVEVAHALLHDGHRALRDLLDALRLAVIDEPTWVALDPERRTLFDVDAPSDLDG